MIMNLKTRPTTTAPPPTGEIHMTFEPYNGAPNGSSSSLPGSVPVLDVMSSDVDLLDYADEMEPLPLPGPEGWRDDLTPFISDDELNRIGLLVTAELEDDIRARDEWLEDINRGLDELGIKREELDKPFKGACSATVPLIEEAARQFQARSMSEMLPPSGPVRTATLGKKTTELNAQAKRVAEFMNYQLTEELEEYVEDTDSMLYYYALTGTAFRKWYFDENLGRPVGRFLRLDDYVPAFDALDMMSNKRGTHIITSTKSQVRALQRAGVYYDCDLTPSEPRNSEFEDVVDEQTGVDRKVRRGDGDDVILLEQQRWLDIEGFEDVDEMGQSTGIELPYVVTVEKDSSKVLGVRRNWLEGDDKKKPLPHVVQWRLLPGLGFYGLGYIHLLGNIQRSATTSLRALVDAGQFANLPAGFKTRGVRSPVGDVPLAFGEFRDVDATSDDLRKSIIPLPYKEPSQTLFALLQAMIDLGRRLAAVNDVTLPDGGSEAPVGTTVALLEQAHKLMSSMHKRMHQSMRRELRILARINAESVPQYYPYEVDNESREVFSTDFDGRVDVLPVSDPNIFSEAQRVMRAQSVLQLAQAAPQVYNQRAAHRLMLESMNVNDPDSLLLPEFVAPPMDPATQLLAVLQSKPVKAWYSQNHQAHVGFLMASMQNPALMAVASTPEAAKTLQMGILALVGQHTGMLIRQQMEQTLQIQLPPPPEYNSENPSGTYEPLPPEIESQIASAMANAAQQLAQQAQQMAQMQKNQQAAQDPAVQIAMQQLVVEREKIAAKERAEQARAQQRATDSQIRAEDADADRRQEYQEMLLNAELDRQKLERESALEARRIIAESKRAADRS
jgi:hypothetical protein